MEKRSRRRIRDLVTLLAFRGLSQNAIGCARISMMAKSIKRSTHGPDTEAQDQSPPSLISGLQHTAGPYRWVKHCLGQAFAASPFIAQCRTSLKAISRAHSCQQRKSRSLFEQLVRALIAVAVQSLPLDSRRDCSAAHQDGSANCAPSGPGNIGDIGANVRGRNYKLVHPAASPDHHSSGALPAMCLGRGHSSLARAKLRCRRSC
jgi:hypothetical protein